MSYFSPTSKGGSSGAKLMHQGSVAAMLSVELLIDPAAVHPARQPVHDWTLRVEQGDDLIVGFADDAQLFVQVKDTKVGRPEMAVIITQWDSLARNAPGPVAFRLQALAGLIEELAALPTDLDAIRARLAAHPAPDASALRAEVKQKYVLNFEVGERHYIDGRPIRQDSGGQAIFASALRRFNDTRMLSETTAELVFSELTDAFNGLIAHRGSLSRADVLATLERFLIRRHPADNLGPYEFVDSSAPERGYQVNADAANQHREDFALVRRIHAALRRRWVRHRAPRALVGFLLGRWERCPRCDHPMMANFGGLRGIACPDCGTFLHLTLAVGCDCGQASVVARQPAPREEELGHQVTDFVIRGGKCRRCGQTVSMERARDRWFVTSFPAWFIDEQWEDTLPAAR